ncbi:hypothetical protein OF83DRAFT_1081377 [Amylostereum chailletii]|nr:hypothetical protein OF83DRAFT_1081377 [Amylostereum chailletii]
MCKYAEEIVQSREQAKYALTIVDKIMDDLGEHQAIGYDIGCSMDATVHTTSLAEHADQLHLQLNVNAFHGYQHKRECILSYHPVFRPGVGMEDFEGCERQYASLNRVVRGVRHASYFHWCQAIHLHLQQWDEDEYAELSNFIFDNYRAALKVVTENTAELESFKMSHKFDEKDFERWHAEEIKYLQSLKAEPEVNATRTSYIEALQSLSNAKADLNQISSVQVLNLNVLDFTNDPTAN